MSNLFKPLGLFVFLVLYLTSVQGGNMFTVPVINDITTTYPNPPQFKVITKNGRDYTYPEEFYPKQIAYYKDLKPLVLNLPAAEVFKIVTQQASRQPRWEVIAVDDKTHSLEATATTALMRFKDDIVIEVRGGSDANTCEVHMRSKSRTGRSDLGANAKRIQEFLASVHRAVSDRR
jgi:uncharacterized protein (DUF1499 family)